MKLKSIEGVLVLLNVAMVVAVLPAMIITAYLVPLGLAVEANPVTAALFNAIGILPTMILYLLVMSLAWIPMIKAYRWRWWTVFVSVSLLWSMLLINAADSGHDYGVLMQW